MCLAAWLSVGKLFSDIFKMTASILFQPGEELFPKDENGKMIFDTVDLCRTWEVSPWRREPRRGSQERGIPLHFFHLWEWAVDHQIQQFMNFKGLLCWGGVDEIIAEMFTGRNGEEFGTMKIASLSFSVIYLLLGFSKEETVILLLIIF